MFFFLTKCWILVFFSSLFPFPDQPHSYNSSRCHCKGEGETPAGPTPTVRRSLEDLDAATLAYNPHVSALGVAFIYMCIYLWCGIYLYSYGGSISLPAEVAHGERSREGRLEVLRTTVIPAIPGLIGNHVFVSDFGYIHFMNSRMRFIPQRFRLLTFSLKPQTLGSACQAPHGGCPPPPDPGDGGSTVGPSRSFLPGSLGSGRPSPCLNRSVF